MKVRFLDEKEAKRLSQELPFYYSHWNTTC